MKKKLLAILIFICVFFAFSMPTIADVGNHVDYGGGGGGYSGGGYSGGSYHRSGSSSSDDDLDAVDIIIGIVIMAILGGGVIVKMSFGSKSKGNNTYNSAPRVPRNHSPEILNAIHNIDPNFSEEKFIAWTKEVFITLQNAWTERDWSRIRPFEKEELYRQHEQQLKEYINNGTINIIERINIKQAYMHLYERDAQYEYLVVYMETRMNDYVIDEKTRAVVKGDKNIEHHLNYQLTFMRKTGVKTNPARSNKSTVSCPHCGAPVTITSAGKCEYCDFIITTGEHDWVLSDLSLVRSDTSIDERGVVINDVNNSDNQ